MPRIRIRIVCTYVIRPSRYLFIIFLYIFSAATYIILYIYTRMTYILLWYIYMYYFSAIFCVLQPYLLVIALLYSDFYPIYYSSSSRVSSTPTQPLSTLIPQRFSEIPAGYVSDVFICRGRAATRRNPLRSGRSIIVVEFNLNWRPKYACLL